MSYYKLYRYPAEGKKVRGVLYLCEDGGRFETLLVKVAGTIENNDVIIPALIYPVAVTMSPKFGTLMPLIRMVPNRTGIRIHRGTQPKHSQGCVLIPKKEEYQSLVERLLYEQEHHEEIRLEIIQLKAGDTMPANVISLNFKDYEKIRTERTRLDGSVA